MADEKQTKQQVITTTSSNVIELEGPLYEFTAKVVGRIHMGKRCVFMDLMELSEEEAKVELELAAKSGEGSEPITHLVNHVAREVPRTVEEMMQQAAQTKKTNTELGCCAEGNEVPTAADEAEKRSNEIKNNFHSIYAAEDENSSLTKAAFDAFTASLGTPGEISKLRIGDILRVSAKKSTSQGKVVNGVPVQRGNAFSVVVLCRGDPAKPGDFGKKWNVPKGSTPTDWKKEGVPRRHGNRFRKFAEWCHETFFPTSTGVAAAAAAATNDSGASLSVLDIAGGSGKLSEAFHSLKVPEGHRHYQCTVVDPRPMFTSHRREKAAMALQQRDERLDQLAAESCAPSATAASGEHDGENNDEPKQPTLSKNQAKKLAKKAAKESGKTPLVIRDFFDISQKEQQDAVDASNLLVGLHCDGAVNEIIKAAATTQTNFAICACCVFPKQYPRMLNSGKQVILRDELNVWIGEEVQRQGFKGRVGSVHVDFEGANEVVFGIADEQ